jgi:hypothetical protein
LSVSPIAMPWSVVSKEVLRIDAVSVELPVPVRAFLCHVASSISAIRANRSAYPRSIAETCSARGRR